MGNSKDSEIDGMMVLPLLVLAPLMLVPVGSGD